MKKNKNIKILVSNDDGVHSKGLHILAKHLMSLGDVCMVAPDRERTAAGHSLTLHKPLRIDKIGEKIFSLNGTPTDCITLGVNNIMRGRPDLIVSGINKGGNLGDDITYSGTVSAAMEGTLLGIPSFAISQVADDDFQFDVAAEFALHLARLIIKHGLSKGTFLNVNVPNLPWSGIKGVRLTSLGKRIYDQNMIIEKVDPRGKKYYWIGSNSVKWEERKDTDNIAIEESMISITPIHLDLTDYSSIKKLKEWEGALSKNIKRGRK